MAGYIAKSKRDDYGTPWEIFDELHDEFRFTLDVCANAGNCKVEHYFAPGQNGLDRAWSSDRCWMNPPYSQTATWLKKALEESRKGALVVALVKAATSEKWFQQYVVEPRAEVRFAKKRIKFLQPDGTPEKHSAPFSSCLVIYRPPSKLWGRI